MSKVISDFEFVGYQYPVGGDYYLNESGEIVKFVGYRSEKIMAVFKKPKWEPKDGERYFHLTSTFSALYSYYSSNFNDDLNRKTIGNCFKTKQEALEASVKIKALLAQ